MNANGHRAFADAEQEAAQAEWEADCMRVHGRILTGHYCHYCGDNCDVPIDETCDAFDDCNCYEQEDDCQ